MMRTALIAILLICAATCFGQPAPVPIEDEPHHHVLLKNDSVEVIRATLQPGESTLFHIHAQDRAGVELLTSTTTEQLWGKSEGPAETSQAGEVYAEACTSCPMAHRVHNIGPGPMDVFNVELLHRPSTTSADTATQVAAENASARVYKWVLPAGTVAAMHTHRRPYLILAVTPFRLKMIGPGGTSQSEDVKPGDFHWIDANVTHALANEGSGEGQIVEIELK